MSYRAVIGGALAVVSVAGGAALADETVSVTLNQARILRLPDKTKTIVIGNPLIADVTTQKHGNLVLTGKSYGATNLIALDDKGNIVAESRIRVDAPRESVVVVQRGMERESYSCAPQCQPTIMPGDSKEYFELSLTQAEKRNALSAPK